MKMVDDGFQGHKERVKLEEYDFKMKYHLNDFNQIEIDTREFINICYQALKEGPQKNSETGTKGKRKKKKKKNKRKNTANYSEEGTFLFQKMIEKNLEIATPLEPEDDEGDTEYKLKLIDDSKERVSHLTTQMKFRLEEGKGQAQYMLGYEDGGDPIGLRHGDMRRSLEILGYLAKENKAEVEVKKAKIGQDGLVMECLIRKKVRPSNKLSFRILMFGNSGSGKSTLISVLINHKLDNGRGLARMGIFRHKHEIMSGLTSSIVSVDLPRDNPEYQTVSGNSRIKQLSLIGKDMGNTTNGVPSVVLIDTGGHSKYQATFLQAFMTMKPNYFFLVQSVLDDSKELEHRFMVSAAMAQEFSIVLTHSDKVDPDYLDRKIQKIKSICASFEDFAPLVVQNEEDAEFLAKNAFELIFPIFVVSNVTGKGINLLRKFVNTISEDLPLAKILERRQQYPTEFNIINVISKKNKNIVGGKKKGFNNQQERLFLESFEKIIFCF
jgi:GTPase